LRRSLPVEQLFGIRKSRGGRSASALGPEHFLPGRGRDVLFLPVIPWFYRWQRPQQLASALARRGNRVFYGTLRGEPNQERGVEAGVILVPLGGVRWEDPPERTLRGGVLRRAEEGLERLREEFALREVVLIAQSPYWEPLADRLRARFGWKVVYDCLDDYPGFSDNRGVVLRRAEARLASRADLVVATSSLLLEKLAPLNRNARLLPNACDYEFFSRVGDAAPRGGRLTIGYIGALEDWFDSALVADLARRRPDWTFDLVGDPHPDVRDRLRGLPNVHLRGERPYGELPSILEGFDLVAIPFALTSLTHATDPVKLYEAFAAGRAVVATPMRQLVPLSGEGLVRLAETGEEFERQILAAAAEDSQAAARRRAFARQNTWDDRARDLEEAISTLFSREETPARNLK
jgi:glycosyltransferase involved in cell wall biosynthesis